MRELGRLCWQDTKKLTRREIRRYTQPVRQYRRAMIACAGIVTVITFIAIIMIARREGETAGVPQLAGLLIATSWMGIIAGYTLVFTWWNVRLLLGKEEG